MFFPGGYLRATWKTFRARAGGRVRGEGMRTEEEVPGPVLSMSVSSAVLWTLFFLLFSPSKTKKHDFKDLYFPHSVIVIKGGIVQQ